MQNRFPNYEYLNAFLAQPTDEPMDDRYKEYFDRQLGKQTAFLQSTEALQWWESYSPAKNTVPDHVLYSDMNPTMVKAMNFDTLASGVTTPLVPSGFD